MCALQATVVGVAIVAAFVTAVRLGIHPPALGTSWCYIWVTIGAFDFGS